MDALAQEDALWLLSSFFTLHRISFDPVLFAQRYPPPIAMSAFAQAADELELALQRRQCGLETALAWKLPLVLALGPSAGATHESPSGVNQSGPHEGRGDSRVTPARSRNDDEQVVPTWALILNADETRVVLIERGMAAPALCPSMNHWLPR